MKRVPIKLREPIIFDKQFNCPYDKPFGYIYKVTNLTNGHMYIGKHKYDKSYIDQSYYGSGEILSKAYKRYGKENFSMEILEWIDTDDSDLNKAEIKWIDIFGTYKFPQHYNMTPGGDGMTSEMVSGENNPMYGKRQSEKCKKIVSQINKNRIWNKDSKSKLSSSLNKYVNSLSDEERNNKYNRGVGFNNPNSKVIIRCFEDGTIENEYYGFKDLPDDCDERKVYDSFRYEKLYNGSYWVILTKSRYYSNNLNG